MAKRTFKFSARALGKKVPTFMEGEKPGVFATQEIDVEVDDSDLKSPQFAIWLLHAEKEFLSDVIACDIEEIVDITNV